VNGYHRNGWAGIAEIGRNTPFLFNAKELDEETGLYYYGARYYEPRASLWLSTDPLQEKYPGVSTYAYCGNNPINATDPTGMDWYWDKEKTRQYNPKLNKENQSKILGEGQTYIGATDQVKDDKGNVTEDYRKDGSIMYSNESSGYRRLWNNTQTTGNEEMGIITDKGVLVLPSWKNLTTACAAEDYGYSFENGKFKDVVTDKTISVLGSMHTHPTLETDLKGNVIHGWMHPSEEDYSYFGDRTPGTPFFVLTADMVIHSRIADATTKANFNLPVVNGRYPNFNGIMFGYPLKNVLKTIRK